MKLFTKIKDKKQTQTDVRGGGGNFSCRHPKLWSYIKSNVKAFFITGAITFVVSASATAILHSRQVRYKNDKSVEQAINELYQKAEQCKMAKIGCIGCTKIEYLESTGTQYIDTGIVPDNSTSVLTSAEPMVYNAEGLFGSRSDLGYNDFRIILSSNGLYTAGMGNTYYKGTRPILEKQVYYLSNTEFTINNTVIYSKDANIYVGNSSIYLFAVNSNNNDVISKGMWKVFSVKIYNDENLVRDYIPVLDKNNRPCMFDKVSKTCFYNQGTGEFLYG